MAASAGVTARPEVPASSLRRYPRPQLTLGRFVAARTSRTGALWGLVVGLYVYLSAVGYADLAPTEAARRQLLDGLASNVGLQALLGQTPPIDSVGVFVDWRALGVWPLVVAIWAILTSTKSLRGEEGAGRLELFLSGPTTARRALLNVLGGLGSALAALFVVSAVTSAVGAHRASFTMSLGQALGVAAVPTLAAAVFMAVGALASQLMPTRARAAGLASGVFGVCFMLRALGDAAPQAHWLVDLSPLGWLEQVQPLGAGHPLWLLPTIAVVVALTLVAVWLADRDLGASTIGHTDSAASRTRLLGSSFGLALRLTRGSILTWLGASAVVGLLYGSFAASAGKAFASSSLVSKLGGDLFGRAEHVGARIYAGVVFLLFMTLVMALVSSAMSNVREQEADGLLDNLLVRSVGRSRWLAERVLIALVVAVVAGLLAGVTFWAGASSQHSGLTAGELTLAGLNAAAPAVLLLGIAVLAFGFVPRWTSRVAYGLLAWAFLLEMLGSAVTINHWVMDTSLLHHVALAPVVDPSWRVVATYVVAGALLAVAGGWRFARRDLAPE